MSYRICTAGETPALKFAAGFLRHAGCTVVPCPDEAVTHLLLPVPSFQAEGILKGGVELKPVLSGLPESVTVIGGNLDCAELAGYKAVDLLRDPGYAAENANITACCAIILAMERLPVVLTGQKALVIGWGRIGKCLARLLKQMGVLVTVAARKASDRAMLTALGYTAIDTAAIDTEPYRLVFNTAPQMLVPHCRGDGLFIELASQPGLGGDGIVDGRGLPGRYAPESSGRLIADRVLTILNKE